MHFQWPNRPEYHVTEENGILNWGKLLQMCDLLPFTDYFLFMSTEAHINFTALELWLYYTFLLAIRSVVAIITENTTSLYAWSRTQPYKNDQKCAQQTVHTVSNLIGVSSFCNLVTLDY